MLARILCLGAAVVPGCVGILCGQDTHPFSVMDMVAMNRLSEPRLSPDSSTVVFVVRVTDLEANSGQTNLWLVPTEGPGLRQLTTHPASDSSPVWAPDGSGIYFLSNRSGSSQIWFISPGGGEARQISDLPLNVRNLAASPDGKSLAATVEVYPDCGNLFCTKNRLLETERKQETGRVFDRLFIRHWDSWEDGRRSHLYVIPVSGGEPVPVMAGMDADTPSEPFGGSDEFTFTPDSKGLVFTARRGGAGESWSTNFDLFQVPADGSAPPRNLTAANPAWDTKPVFSLNGRMLAYLAMERPGFEADRFRVAVMDWPDGSVRWVAPDWDRSPGELTWTPDSTSLLATAENLGHQSLFGISVSTGSVQLLVKEGNVSSPAQTDNLLVFLKDTLRSPAELFSARPDGSEIRPLTQINGRRLAQARLGETEQFTFSGWNDETVYAWVVKPVDFNPSLKYPVAFLIHGGPQGSFGNHFHYRWNPQAYAGAGYAAIMVDFHGSTGYGQEFTDSIRGDWGGKPLVDLQKGLEAALQRYPWMDGERVCALGASYGGYMVNWIAGNWPDRFKCLVSHDGEFDARTMYYATEELWFPEWEHGGTYYDNPQGHEKHNPANHVEKWKTPMLVIHGANDFRIPLEQGIATFTALQRRSIPSRFLFFPDENHWVLKPRNSIQWHEQVLGWLDKWLK